MTWWHSADPVLSPASDDALHLQAHRLLSHFENGGQLLANEDHEDLL